jgi:hypothetical protein
MDGSLGIAPLDLSEHATHVPTPGEDVNPMDEMGHASSELQGQDAATILATGPIEAGWSGTVLGTPPSACSDSSPLAISQEQSCDVSNANEETDERQD